MKALLVAGLALSVQAYVRACVRLQAPAPVCVSKSSVTAVRETVVLALTVGVPETSGAPGAAIEVTDGAELPHAATATFTETGALERPLWSVTTSCTVYVPETSGVKLG